MAALADDALPRPRGACLDESGAGLPPDGPPEAERDASSTVGDAEIHAYLRMRATRRRISVVVTAFVAAKTPESIKDPSRKREHLCALCGSPSPP